MLDHVLDQLLFPLVLGPSFVSAQNPFPLKPDTLAQGTWSDGLPIPIPLLWKFHEPNAQGTFRMGKPEYACLPIPIYKLLRSFQLENVCSDVGAIKLCWWTISRKQSCSKVAAKLQVHVLFVGFDHGLKYRRADDRYRKVTLEDVSHGCHSLPTSHPRYVEPTIP